MATAAAAAASSSSSASANNNNNNGHPGCGVSVGGSGGGVGAGGGLFEPEITIRRLYKSCRKSLPGASPPSLGGVVGGLNCNSVSVSSGGGSHTTACSAGCSGCSLSAAAAAAASIQLANFIGSQMLLPSATVDVTSTAGLINQNSTGFSCITTKIPPPPSQPLTAGGGGAPHTHQSTAAGIVASQTSAHHATASIAATTSACTSNSSTNSALLPTPKKNSVHFNCNYCSFTCSWKYDLKLHLRQKHGIHNKKM